MKPIITVIISAFLIIGSGCQKPTPDCTLLGQYTEECPCQAGWYPWQSLCIPKDDNGLDYRGSTAEIDCLKDFLVLISKDPPYKGFMYVLPTGFREYVHFIYKDETFGYSEIIGGCEAGYLPAFQVVINLNDVSEQKDTVRGTLRWWHHEDEIYHDLEEEVLFVKHR